ncbi:DUF4238 domain-containing protein [Inquilinus sp. CA228]|uniref:DUF4238 domain-containing protein n=1 Tax=Inquilinus sp. CA228 TaxID=3455609 RepID=UPI003F8D378F
MAQNKNQHYVPRCHLDAFSVNNNRKSINMFHILNGNRIQNAPIKGQCAKAYFYGKDLILERALQFPEGEYATVVREMSSPEFSLTPQHIGALKRFWLLQYHRTDAASRRTAMMMADQDDIVFRGNIPPEHQMSEQDIVHMGIRVSVRTLNVIEDLKVCLVRNVTRTPFITSDDPAILTNRWYNQNKLARGRSHGAGNSGALLMLPLSPAIYCIMYDGDVYNIANSAGWVVADKFSDVSSLNQLQIIKCQSTLYFDNWEKIDYIQQIRDDSISLRPNKRHEIVKMILAYTDEEGEHYRPFDGSEWDKSKPLILQARTHEGWPNRWPSFIRFRASPKIYTNGSETGFARRAVIESEFLGAGGFHLI